MTQHKPPQAMTLFDLIARSWTLETAVQDLRFNASSGAVMAQLADGRLSFVSVKDAESPDSRVRVEADTGRASIRPRTKPLPVPLTSKEPVAMGGAGFSRLGAQGFAFVHEKDGALWRATARGQTLALKTAQEAPVSALATLAGKNRLVLARGDLLSSLAEEGGAELASATLQHEVSRIHVAPDETIIACWGENRLSIVTSEALSVQTVVDFPGPVLDLAISPCGQWLVAGCADKSVRLLDLKTSQSDQIVDFPAEVTNIGFSNKANAMIASGAFRVVGWALPDLPFAEHSGDPLETGKPGLTLVDRIAIHPKRDLCAVAYATGLIMLCRIGTPDEMLVREATQNKVSALAWSDDGAHLAIGDTAGDLSIVTFPKNMFK